MKEIQDIIDAYDCGVQEGHKLAIAIMVNVKGSSYRRIGARMLIFPDGRWLGGISGGCLEDDVLRQAKLALFEDEPQYVRYDTSQERGDGIGVALGCNGIIEILICPINPYEPDNPIVQLKQCLEKRKEQFLMTVIAPGNSGLNSGATYCLPESSNLNALFPRTAFVEKLELNYAQVCQQKRSQLCQFGENIQVLLEYLPPPIHLVICGGHYDVIPLLQFARQLGWKTTVVANPDKVQQNIPQLADAFFPHDSEKIKIDQHTAILLMSHDIETDKANLAQYLTSSAPYIGLLGPRDRTERIVRELGIADKSIDKLFAPIGIDIGADNPEEIALSIMAEIKAIFSGRTPRHLRTRTLPIHERI